MKLHFLVFLIASLNDTNVDNQKSTHVYEKSTHVYKKVHMFIKKSTHVYKIQERGRLRCIKV